MRADRYIYGQNARRPRPIDRPPKPLPDQGEEEETNVPNQRGRLPAPLPGNRACQPSVPNLYMAAKIKLKLFERASLRLLHQANNRNTSQFPCKSQDARLLPDQDPQRRYAAVQLRGVRGL